MPGQRAEPGARRQLQALTRACHLRVCSRRRNRCRPRPQCRHLHSLPHSLVRYQSLKGVADGADANCRCVSASRPRLARAVSVPATNPQNTKTMCAAVAACRPCVAGALHCASWRHSCGNAAVLAPVWRLCTQERQVRSMAHAEVPPQPATASVTLPASARTFLRVKLCVPCACRVPPGCPQQ